MRRNASADVKYDFHSYSHLKSLAGPASNCLTVIIISLCSGESLSTSWSLINASLDSYSMRNWSHSKASMSDTYACVWREFQIGAPPVWLENFSGLPVWLALVLKWAPSFVGMYQLFSQNNNKRILWKKILSSWNLTVRKSETRWNSLLPYQKSLKSVQGWLRFYWILYGTTFSLSLNYFL